MKSIVVVGLGRFGSAVATQLCALGNEVLVIDSHPDQVQAIADRVTHAVVGDATDEEVLRSLGVRDFDCAIVAIGSDLSASVLITLSLKELGVRSVICKAQSTAHKKVLEKIGADRVVFPEREMALKLAQGLTSSSVLDYIELSPDYGIAEVAVPTAWVGKTIREVNVRAKYGVNILALQIEGEMIVSPGANQVFLRDSVVVMLGRSEDLGSLQAL
jgi:trk system potassium uptake protein TrkA